MTEYPEKADKTENKPEMEIKRRSIYARAPDMGPVNPGPQTSEKEEEKSKWNFDKKPLTIREMIALKVPPKEIFEAEGISLSIKWTSLIRVVNHKMISGNKLDLDTTMMDAIKAYSACMGKSFF